MANEVEVTLVHPRDPLVVHISRDGDLLVNGTICTTLQIQTEDAPVRVDVVDPTGTWVLLPPSGWQADPAGSGVHATLGYTDGEEPVAHELVIHPSGEPQAAKPRPVPIKVKPRVVAFDRLGGALPSTTKFGPRDSDAIVEVSVKADYGSLSDFAEVVAAIDELNRAALVSIGCRDRRVVRLIDARMNSPLMFSFGVFMTVVALAPPLLIAVWRVVEALIRRSEAKSQLDEARTRGAEVLAQTCAELGREPSAEAVAAIETLSARLLEFTALARRSELEIRVGPVKLKASRENRR